MHFRNVQNTETQTVPPLKGNYSANVSQWVIHDEYAKDFEAQQKNKEKKVQQIKRNVSMKNGDKSSDDSQIRNELGKWKILERMINQNIFSDITYGKTASSNSTKMLTLHFYFRF